MDWESRTAAWVEAGLLEPHQRAAILADLEADPPEAAAAPGAPFADALIATIVTAGAWLLAGSVVVAMAVVGVKEPYASSVILGMMAVQGAVGLGLRWVLGRSVAEGLWAAAVPVVSLSLVSMLAVPFEPRAGWLALLLVAPALVGTLVATMDRMSVLAFTSAFAGLLPLCFQLTDAPRGFPELVAVASLGWIAVVAVFVRVSRERFALLAGQVPVAAFVGVAATLAHAPWLAGMQIPHVRAWESAAVLVGYGTVTLVFGAVARSWGFLVAGGAALVVAEAAVLFTVGDALIGTFVLGAEGLVVLTAVIAYAVVRASRSTDGRPTDVRRKSAAAGAET